MHHTLTRDEYKELLNVKCLNLKHSHDDYLYINDYYDDSQAWDRKLSGLNHLFSIILEQYEKLEIDTKLVINYVYSLPNSCDFEIQEGGIDFLSILIDEDFSTNIEIEERLINTQNKIFNGR